VELLPEINSVILKEKFSAKSCYLTGCKSRKFYHVKVLVVGVTVVLVVVVVVVVVVVGVVAVVVVIVVVVVVVVVV
jgi:hypothetical protein